MTDTRQTDKYMFVYIYIYVKCMYMYMYYEYVGNNAFKYRRNASNVLNEKKKSNL